MFTLTDVLDRDGIAATDVTVMLHSPRIPALMAVLPSLVRTRRAAMEAYQATHSAGAETSSFDAAPPDWCVWVLGAAELRALPPGWAARLREWRGVYLITDRTDGARYVGSAYGETNLLGRWSTHVTGEAGVTAQFAARDPSNFVFSILERVSPDMDIGAITALEQSWMTRLHSRTHGLNA